MRLYHRNLIGHRVHPDLIEAAVTIAGDPVMDVATIAVDLDATTETIETGRIGRGTTVALGIETIKIGGIQNPGANNFDSSQLIVRRRV